MAHANQELMTPLVSTEEIAAAIGVHPQTVRALVNKGRIPVVRVGCRLHRYDRAAVLKALALGRDDARRTEQTT